MENVKIDYTFEGVSITLGDKTNEYPYLVWAAIIDGGSVYKTEEAFNNYLRKQIEKLFKHGS